MKPTQSFASTLSHLKTKRNISSAELASEAGVPPSLISGLLHGSRVIGEFVARKLAKALSLNDEETEGFVYLAVNNCTEKVLERSKAYPAELLNLIAGELHNQGILPDSIVHCMRKPADDTDATLYLNNGKKAVINLEIAYR